MSRYVRLVIYLGLFCVNVEYAMQAHQISRMPGSLRLKIRMERSGCLVNIISDFLDGNKDYDDVTKLLQNKKFSKKDKLAATILVVAKGQMNLLSKLLENKVAVHSISKYIWLQKYLSCNKFMEIHAQWSPLCFAVLANNKDLVRLLFQNKASFKDLEKSKGFKSLLVERYGQEKVDNGLSIVKQMEQEGHRKQKGEPTETDPLLLSNNNV